jgi:hypothetical protein
MGEAVPNDMDGRVLVEALDEDFVAANPIEFETVDDDLVDSTDGPRMSFTQDESDLIAKRLQALGYIK